MNSALVLKKKKIIFSWASGMCLFLVSVTVMFSISCFDVLFADCIEAPQLITHDNSTEKFFSRPLDMRDQNRFKLPLFLVTRQNLWHH